jgi:hypothetical protein
MVHKLEILGDPEDLRKVVGKYMCLIPEKFSLVAISIESLLNVDPVPAPPGSLHLQEPQAHVFLNSDDDDELVKGWYLDTSAMSYMTGRAETFFKLDCTV